MGVIDMNKKFYLVVLWNTTFTAGHCRERWPQKSILISALPFSEYIDQENMDHG